VVVVVDERIGLDEEFSHAATVEMVEEVKKAGSSVPRELVRGAPHHSPLQVWMHWHSGHESKSETHWRLLAQLRVKQLSGQRLSSLRLKEERN
jgi:hypothetical protein